MSPHLWRYPHQVVRDRVVGARELTDGQFCFRHHSDRLPFATFFNHPAKQQVKYLLLPVTNKIFLVSGSFQLLSFMLYAFCTPGGSIGE